MQHVGKHLLRSFIMKYVFVIFTVLLLAPHTGVYAGEQNNSIDSVLSNLRMNKKLIAPDSILADFANNALETEVIVRLQPTSAASVLAAQSLLSVQVPAEFTRPAAPTYYNLQDESIKTQLHSAVNEAVGQVIDRLGATGMTVTQRFYYQFGFAARVTPAALERIVALQEVISVEKDVILQAHLAQGIPLMNASTVRSSYTGSGLSIAICDTGIDTSHPRLGGGSFPNAKVIGGYDTGDNDSDPRPHSVNGVAHGTACAGIAAGDMGTVGDYIGGVAPGAKLYSIKISTGNTGSASSSAMIAGWEWAVSHKNDDTNNPIMIISTSFGGGNYSSTCDSQSPSMTTAAANAVAAGITIFASSGNDGYCGSIAWPACISYVNSVGAVYDANFGTYLPCVKAASCATKTATTGCSSGWYVTDSTAPDKVTSYSNSASFLTMFAPANQAYTTDIVGAGGYSSGDYDTSFGGTSAACPYAAGSAAVLQQAAKAKTGSFLTPAQVKSYLVNNGDNVTDSKIAITKPRINLGKAVNALIATPDFTLAASPTSVSVSQGGAGSTTVTTTVSGGFSNAISLAASGLPTGTAASFTPATIAAPGSGSSTLTLTTTSATPTGSYTVTVTGTGGGVTHTAHFTLYVTSLSGGSITTTFTGSTSQNGNMFDIAALNNDLIISRFDLNLNSVVGTTSIPVRVYYKTGTYVGSENASSAWTLLNTYAVTSAGPGNPSPMPIDNLTISAGQVYGIYITRTDGSSLIYTSGANSYSDGNVQMTLGAGIAYPFGSIFSPRTWNGTVYYTRLQRKLTVSISGNGSVNSSPAGIACVTGNSGTCNNLFNNGSTITLIPSPAIDSIFNSWSGCTSISGSNCLITLSADRTVNANFSIDSTPVRIPGGGTYSSLQSAYDSAAMTCTIQVKAVELTPLDFSLNNGKIILLEGGYDSGFSSNGGLTTMNGILTLGSGSLTVENLVIK